MRFGAKSVGQWIKKLNSRLTLVASAVRELQTINERPSSLNDRNFKSDNFR